MKAKLTGGKFQFNGTKHRGFLTKNVVRSGDEENENTVFKNAVVS